MDYVLAQPLSETLMVAGRAESIMAAHVMAQAGLTQVLGGDAVEAWSLKAMDHVWAENGVEFQAQFVRNPEHEADPR
jgi:hypothetical protein